MNLWFLRFWLLLHLAVIAFALSALPWKIDADMYSILPASHNLREIGKAEQAWSQNASANFMILIGSENFEKAKENSLSLYKKFLGDSSLENWEIHADSNYLSDLKNFFFENRMFLQTREFAQTLNSGNAEKIRLSALSKVYGISPLSTLDNLNEDPFLLGENGIERIVNSSIIGTSWDIKDGLRVAKDSGNYYILINGKLAKHISAFADENNVVSKIKAHSKDLQSREHSLRIAFSGVPFHTNESSESSKKEIAVITAISLSAIFLLFLFAFRSPFPLLAVIGAITLSALFSASASIIIFGYIHIFTLVFGTSLIGISLDYSLHFFAHWKSAKENETGFSIRSRIISCLSLGFLTTMLGYAALALAPFPLLRQMAVFSFFGLLSAFLSVSILFPYIKLPPQNKRGLIGYNVSKANRKAIAVVFLLFAAVLLFGLPKLRIENNIREFYSMSNQMRESELIASRIMNMTAGLFYIVSGNTREEMLENEESLCISLDSISGIGSYLSISGFVPSLKTQSEVYSAIEKHLLNMYEEQFLYLGFDSSSAKHNAYAQRDKFKEGRDKFLTINDTLPLPIRQAVNKLQIGEIDGKFYSAVLLMKISDKKILEKLQTDNIVFVDKAGEISGELTLLSKNIIFMISLAYLISFVILSFIYNLKYSFCILSIPILSSAISVSALSLLGYSLNFFALSGAVLTLAIGIDYSLFFSKGEGDKRVILFAIFLSMLTTALSFGALSFSSFMPISQLGLSVLIGIVSCFILSFFLLHGNKDA